MKAFKRLGIAIMSTMAFALASCGSSKAYAEQKFAEPVFSDNIATIALEHKSKSTWYDFLRLKGSSVELEISEYGDLNIANATTVPLKRSAALNDDDTWTSTVLALQDAYDLEYLESDYYTPDEEESSSSEEAKAFALYAVEEVSSEEQSSSEESASEGTSSSEATSEESSEKTSSSAEESSSSEEEATTELDNLFPIKYGGDALATKFSINLEKFAFAENALYSGDKTLFEFSGKMTGTDTVAVTLGTFDKVLAYVDGLFVEPIEIGVQSVYGESFEYIYLAPEHPFSFTKNYFESSSVICGVDASFSVFYSLESDTAETTIHEARIDLDSTLFLDDPSLEFVYEEDPESEYSAINLAYLVDPFIAVSTK